MYTNPMHSHGPQDHHGQGHHGHHVVYQAEPNWQHMAKQKRDHVMHALHPHMGRKVRITTIDGHTHEGVLINSDGHHVYLHVDHHGHGHNPHNRPIYTPAQYNQIITLVLFELLVILLLA